MNKIKWLFAASLASIFMFLGGVNIWASETEIDTSVFRYRENEDGTIYIAYYYGSDETVVVPSEIDGKSVTAIKCSAFKGCNTMKYLIIQEGITDILDGGIFDGAFISCENLETVTLPSTLRTIGDNAFSECYKLKEINLPVGLVSIGCDAFFRCFKLNNINLPEGLTRIGDHAFSNCESIEKLIIPDSVNNIGENAFMINYDEHIPIYANPDSYAKTYCDLDRKINFSCINHPNIEIDPAVAPDCKNYGRTEGSHCTVCGTAIIKQQSIAPNEKHDWKVIVVTGHIKDYKCTVCGKIKTETIGLPPETNQIYVGRVISHAGESYTVTKSDNTEKTVEFTALNPSVGGITIPNAIFINGGTYKVTSIAKNAFKNNKKLKYITIGSNITSIGAGAFRGCRNLKTITVKSKNLKSVGKNALKGIHPKAKIKVPSGKLAKYKKKFAKKGQKSTVKIV